MTQQTSERYEPTDSSDEQARSDRIYTPSAGERQLTPRAVIAGALLGSVVGAMNVSIGLKIGWSFGGSLIAAILGYAVFAVIGPKTPYTVLETNITQTTGSAAGAMASAAGLLAPIPALAMLDDPIVLSWWQLLLWAFAVAYLGVFFAVPLRRQMVAIEKLRFPSGTATAETIVSIFARGGEAIRRARVLLRWAIVAAAFVLLTFEWTEGWIGPHFEQPVGPILEALREAGVVGSGFGTLATAWGFTLLISPVMLGAGLLIGPRIGISLLLGAITGWLVLGTTVQAQAWVDDPDAIMSYSAGVRGWILWPGVAIMVGDALTSLGLSWRTIVNTFRPARTSDSSEIEPAEERVPNHWWIIGLLLGSTATVLVTWIFFDIPPWMSIVGIILSSVLAAIAVRSTGETDINPVGGMGKVTQLVFGGFSQAGGQAATQAISANLMGAAITGSGASQAADMMQDLKTGRMLGAMPRRQIVAQCIGIAVGIFVVVPIYGLFARVHDIGAPDSDYPAPAAKAWQAMAELLAEGFGSLPTHASWAVLGGLILGILMPVLRKNAGRWAFLVPSGLAFGIAFIVPAKYPIAMCLGSIVLVLWRRRAPQKAAALAFAVASGLIAGEGVMNVVTALIRLVRQSF